MHCCDDYSPLSPYVPQGLMMPPIFPIRRDRGVSMALTAIIMERPLSCCLETGCSHLKNSFHFIFLGCQIFLIVSDQFFKLVIDIGKIFIRQISGSNKRDQGFGIHIFDNVFLTNKESNMGCTNLKCQTLSHHLEQPE